MADRRHTLHITGIILLLFLLSPAWAVHAAGRQFRNVIIMVPDGCGSAHTTLARWYKGSALSLDRMDLAGMRTYGADSLITDSAPAATAFATGHKSSDGSVGVLPGSVTIPGVPPVPEDRKYKPVVTVLEGARLVGKSVGLVATSNIQHATPAAFSAHSPKRSDFNEIAKQQVYQGMDVVLGGGKRYLLPGDKGGTRNRGDDLVEVIKSKGYAFVETREDLGKVRGRKIWGAFADDAMAYDFDRTTQRPTEPTLAEMTGKALEVLSGNPKGFFLFVEGSKVDWASHAHDPVGVISDVLAFDKAVGVALDFAQRDGSTLVLAFTDHGTGGMSIGSETTDRIYSRFQPRDVLARLTKAVLTAEGVALELAALPPEKEIREKVARFYGIDDLSPDEITLIRNGKDRLHGTLGLIMSKRSHIGWTTRGHTGEDVFLYHYGYGRPLGMIENTEVARMTARAMGFDLSALDNRLFVSAREVFRGPGVSLSLDGKSKGKERLVVQKGGAEAEFLLGTNLMVLSPSGRKYEMEGIAVLAPKTGRVYLPGQASALFEQAIAR